jgi:hypothetical protein
MKLRSAPSRELRSAPGGGVLYKTPIGLRVRLETTFTDAGWHRAHNPLQPRSKSREFRVVAHERCPHRNALGAPMALAKGGLAVKS